MARIRSVHPGLFTDEAFVALTADAQIFDIGLWTEADDQGVFEWKPVTLRMRLRPTKDGAVEPILAELEAGNIIRRFSFEGRDYGAIRNFRKFQKPKSPNAIYPLPHEFRNYVGLAPLISEIDEAAPPPKEKPKPPQRAAIPPNGEIAPQMEGRGGEKKEQTKPAASHPTTAAPPSLDEVTEACFQAIGDPEQHRAASSPGLLNMAPILRFLDAGYDLKRIVGVLRSMAGKLPRSLGSWSYFASAIEEELGKPPPAPPKPNGVNGHNPKAIDWDSRERLVATRQAPLTDWGDPWSWPEAERKRAGFAWWFEGNGGVA